ncbi:MULTISPECIES: (deoxy)nucleoside triphosphate pyrophosphohydrolase [Vibrio]|uniref:(deoxy)nucleoside triphosphate pyrophosphohydrolase n=1 Tax=Vibrio TaxID=662 RepID=UPI001124C74F|nr:MULTISPECIES: (deoxy)nucleoside triphosphate pyrophosphohydrolase [Vibrio harveyi group]KAB2113560.1 (deoxy)nucleoside triphosphate pyrophosphohydrolase [Vibrio alginolyticus]MCS0214381.1 (deoxy)nucleoside triphosphate pyrophosphohydrolase [Vibrio alginolyticus]MCS0252613.1 (deoxy)nucleoside triphosphate pyrophosphohydrolase [Vibrio alginolyticus]TOG59488.1 DNA mismatch repair protein MutT [Vibrio parahaemolyticus]TOG60696.1 DNA mismatch repair protein MutT [Vibrio parahaemolyticus]|tara:strand:- start:4208 stop:4597 length:390 start_codon:yes stop_codon:yes gene_type:complete
MKRIEVVAAVIQHEGKTLCVQRGPAKFDYIHHKFEFPGGKVEPDETGEQAIMRELKEELRIDIPTAEYFMTVEHSYPDFHITMHAYICPVENRDIELTEHIDAKWLSLEDLPELDWAAADVPIVNKLKG